MDLKVHLASLLLLSLGTLYGTEAAAVKSRVVYSRQAKQLENLDTCDTDGSEYRLSRAALPISYKLTLRPNLDNLTFDGEESIFLKLNQDNVTEITLHQMDLTVFDVVFVGATKEIKSTKNVHSEKLQATTYTFEEPIGDAEGSLRLKFNGTLDDKLKGFYRSKYVRPDGTDAYAAVTQFEPTDARRAFPCFDEPAFKATFDVTLVVKKGLTALSNMPEVSRAHYVDKNYDVVRYDTSPKMSTYLLAVVVGDFDYIEGRTKSGTLLRVYTPEGKTKQGTFSLDVGIRSLDLFEEYFQVAYPLPKMDMIAIPDFAAGAMENWGLVTYRDRALLVDDQATSLPQKQQIALTVAHELAHQWFGNLVTMKWWTDLWLNEGFASFMMYYSVDKMFPEWNLWQKFVVDTFSQAVNLDAMDNSHPIEVPIEDPNSVQEIFDVISYKKGSSVLRMLHDWVGDEMFRDGLRLYLSRHKYGNTCTKDLWAALEEKSSLPIRQVMTTWTRQKGFPLVSVSETQRTNDVSILTLSQKKFAANGSLAVSERKVKWEVPITFTTKSAGDNSTQKDIMSERFRSFVVPIKSRDEWVKLNSKSVGFYRTQYPEEMLARLIPAVEAKELDIIDRLQLQSDLFALVRAGYDSSTKFLHFLKAYKNENNYFVWDSISDSVGSLDLLLSNTNYSDALKPYGIELFSGVYERISWDEKQGEDPSNALLRSLVLSMLGSFGYEKVVKEAHLRFIEHNRANGQKIDADIRGAIYRTVAANMTDEEFDVFFDMYKKAEVSSEKSRIGGAMGSSEKESQIKKVLKFALSSAVRAQDTSSILVSVTGTLVGRETAWKFFKENKDELVKRYGNDYLIGRLIKGVTAGFASEAKAKEVDDFFKRNNFPGAQRAVQQALESIRLKAAWLEKDGENIRTFLSEKSQI